MSYLGDGAAQGLLQLSNVFGNILAQRMTAGFEDAQYQKRLEAANKAELEKMKTLEEWKKTQIAESRPFAGPDGSVMVQDVNYAGGVIGPARQARADESFGFTTAQEKLKQERALAEARLDKETAAAKKYETDAKIRERMAPLDEELKRAQTGAASRASRPDLATPKSKDLSKEIFSAKEELQKLKSMMSAEDHAYIKSMESDIMPPNSDYDEPPQNILQSYRTLLLEAQNRLDASMGEEGKKGRLNRRYGLKDDMMGLGIAAPQ